MKLRSPDKARGVYLLPAAFALLPPITAHDFPRLLIFISRCAVMDFDARYDFDGFAMAAAASRDAR